MNSARHEFWRRHPGLVWSNPEAGESVHMRAALLRPRFGRLPDIAVEFGVDRLRLEWAILESEGGPEIALARDSVNRILGNIEKGFARAAA